MRVLSVSLAVLGLAATSTAFVPAAAPRGRDTQMILGNLFNAGSASGARTTPVERAKGKSSGGRLNLKTIPKDSPKPKKAAAAAGPSVPQVKLPSFSFGGKKQTVDQPTARVVNGKLQGYFSEEQVEALQIARRTVPSNAPNYWQQIAAQVPGQDAETCKAMANQLALDRARGTKKNFFGGNIEVKETKMYVDESATVGNRFKQAFGLK